MPAKAGFRIGIFGGTFDPIHFGHLRAAEEAREILGLDQVLLVPIADPPHKRNRPISGAPQRMAMLRLAIRGHAPFRASPIEIERPGLSFTIDTLRQLRRKHRDAQLVLLMGLDAFAELDTWKEYRALFAIADIAVLSRPPQSVRHPKSQLPVAVQRDFRYAPGRKSLVNSNGNQVFFLSVTALDIAATDIRERVSAGRSIRFLVPPAVERFIRHERLYHAAGRSRV